MKHKNNFRLILLVLITITIFSCQDEPLDFEQPQQTVIQDDEFAVLGKKREIAFTVENMQKAYEAILNNPTASKYPRDIQYRKNNSTSARFTDGSYQITTTHHYIKFNPQDSLQYERIANDTILAVSDIPFEYDIDTEGAKYQDPDLAGTDFTYYYSVVPIDYQLPNDVPYENLANLHFTKEDLIPDDAPELELQKIDFFHDLNTEALKQTDNLEEEKEDLIYLFTNVQGQEEQLIWQDAQNRGLNLNELVINFNEDDYQVEGFFSRRRKWTPSGTITVQEDAINQSIGVNKVRVRVRKWGWLVIRKARTNVNGYFQTSRTRTKRVKYAAYFNHRPDFTVKAGTWFWNARDRGHRTHKRRAWRRHYTYGRRQLYSFVHNAAYDYYKRIIQTYGLRHPGHHMKISAKYNLCASSQHRPAILSLLPVSRIRVTRRNGNCQYRGSDGIYATTVHELTHAGHRRMDTGMFSIFHSGSCDRAFLKESWAEGVETIVTNDRYDALTNNNYQSSSQNDINAGRDRWNGSRQESIVQNMTEYTPIVEDLIDNENQNTSPNAPGNQPIDRVNSYNLNQIQNALNNCRDIDCWERNLRNNYFNTTENNLNELFNYMRAARVNNNPDRCD
jgi:hypothetical protein|tara:strand:- start:555 stop:2411 length:1857 start_codon:yes stop_codon:yes gene_type:complete